MSFGRVIVFGATGKTGVCVVEEALSKGYEVTAFSRDTSKLPDSLSSRVNSIDGDVTNLMEVKDAVDGHNAVIIVLGTKGDLNPTTMLSEGTNNILTAIQGNGVNNVIVCLSSFLLWDSDKIPPQYYDLNEEHKRMLDCCKNSNEDWIAVCPPRITDDSASWNYKVGVGERVGDKISKYDLAHFIVELIPDYRYKNQLVSLAEN